MKPSDDVPLAPLATLGVGGAAQHYVEAAGEPEVVEALDWARERALQVAVLGGGSNVVVADRGVSGLVLRMRDQAIAAHADGDDTVLTVGAGRPWDELVAWAVEHDLCGLECLSGIPGDVGAAPIQNVGAYGQEVGPAIEAVTAIERTTGARHELDRAGCGFAYRDSIFKRAADGRYVVTSVRLRLRPGPATIAYPELERAMHESAKPRTLAAVRAMVIELRRRKSMVLSADDENRHSVGSFFLNPIVSAEEAERVAALDPDTMPRYPADAGVKLSAAWLIERAGLPRGSGEGRVGLSTRHTLAIVNRGGATAAEIVAFAVKVRARVADRFAVRLQPEPRFLGFEPEELSGLSIESPIGC